ncbi:hypothetical protein Naga_100306g4 [Nannochloropsis gaditana]|uniref:Uncharacterized protein n=1 Tax=Nannochloropsis gaditana TaxID=72520 RepID=W7TD16_9STRA|nr:hypothetical protein Naga_100306g4 [Nannochloropsis gaditana]
MSGFFQGGADRRIGFFWNPLRLCIYSRSPGLFNLKILLRSLETRLWPFSYVLVVPLAYDCTILSRQKTSI